MLYKKTKMDISVAGSTITPEESTVYLSHTVSSDLKHDIDGIYSKFYKQYNVFRTRFVGVPSSIKSQLFISFCSSLYGIQICDKNWKNTNCMEKVSSRRVAASL